MFLTIKSTLQKWQQKLYLRSAFQASVILGLLAFIWSTGCFCSQENYRSFTPDDSKVVAVITSTADSARYGQRVTHQLDATSLGDETQSTLQYSPPPGATNITFSGAQPTNPNPPPYIFENHPTASPIDVSFNMPTDTDINSVTEYLIATSDNGSQSTFSNRTDLFSSASTTNSETNIPAPAIINQPSDSVELWTVSTWIDAPAETPMTTELCQEWLDFLRSDDVFIASRLPIADVNPNAYSLPVVFWENNKPSFTLFDQSAGWPYSEVVSGTLEYKPERITFAENNLPAKSGEQWIALGAADDVPESCPAGVDIPADEWHLRGTGSLNLNNQPNNCEGCAISTYLCYEGQEIPAPLGSNLLSLGARLAGVNSFQGEGITCVGPNIEVLGADPDFSILETSAAIISPTQVITFQHYILTDNPISITLDYTSTLPVQWHLYDGDLNELSNPFHADGFEVILLISDPVPVGTPDGSYSLTIKISSGAMSDQTSDGIWVGDWVAPPENQAEDRLLFLPLLNR